MSFLDRLKWPLSSISGIFVILFYCIFTLISAAMYVGPWDPWPYLSDFGNTSVGFNPNGASFYNLACILTGIMLFPFYIGLYKWYTKETWRKILVIITQIAGVMSAFSLIMIGVFYENSLPAGAHGLWSYVFFVLNLLVLIFANISLITHRKFIKLIAIYGIVVAIINLAFVIIGTSSVIEWFTVFTALGYAGLLVINMLKAFPRRKK